MIDSYPIYQDCALYNYNIQLNMLEIYKGIYGLCLEFVQYVMPLRTRSFNRYGDAGKMF